MILPELNRDKPDQVYVSVLNDNGQTLTTGYPVALDIITSIDGVNARLATSASNYPGFIGVAKRDIAINDYGLVQVGGYIASVFLSNTGTSITINAGDPLIPAPAGFFSGAPTYANSGFKFVHASNVPIAVSAAGYASGVIKLV